MIRALYWVGVFLLAAVVAHLAYVLLAPRQAANAMMQQAHKRMGANSFHVLSGTALRRFVRHPVTEGAYGACLMDMSEAPVRLKGPDLRTLWALTVYSPRGDVLYAITDRHVPAGPLEVLFEYREVDRSSGEIALPKLRGNTMVVPMDVKSALLLLEAWPWHPGQTAMLKKLMRQMTCAALPRDALKTPQEDGKAAAPVPRERPARGKTEASAH